MVSIKDINKKIKKNLFDPLDKSKNKFYSFLENIKKNKVKKDLALQKQLEKEKKRELILEKKLAKKAKQDELKEERKKLLFQKKLIIENEKQEKKNYNGLNISVLKGPCLAKELARKNHTSVIIANKNIQIAKKIGKMIATKYYIIKFSNDVIGVEICSAIKNIYAMIIGAGQSLNTSSSLFQKSIIEMNYLTKYFKGKEETTLGLAGIGDLYVSAAGGRNSKMGSYLGKGFTFKNAKKKFMPKDTVEGEQLAREIAPYILKKIIILDFK